MVLHRPIEFTGVTGQVEYPYPRRTIVCVQSHLGSGLEDLILGYSPLPFRVIFQ